jgi:hypothetical protein
MSTIPWLAGIVVRSTDRGRSWSAPVEAARVLGRVFSEPSLVQGHSGKLLLLLREEVTGYVYQSESYDDGYSWQRVHSLPCWGYPTHAISLSDGRLVMVFGRRKPPYGICGAVSTDEGRSWSDEFEICHIAHDSNGGLNLGYPSVVEYAPGQLCVAFYSEDRTGLTAIYGTKYPV